MKGFAERYREREAEDEVDTTREGGREDWLNGGTTEEVGSGG